MTVWYCRRVTTMTRFIARRAALDPVAALQQLCSALRASAPPPPPIESINSAGDLNTAGCLFLLSAAGSRCYSGQIQPGIVSLPRR